MKWEEEHYSAKVLGMIEVGVARKRGVEPINSPLI